MKSIRPNTNDRLTKMVKRIVNEDITSMDSTISTPIVPIPLPADIVSMINDRLSDEYTAHYLYNCAANWCNDAGYLKAGSFFLEESKSELEHARKLQDFLVSWNIIPELKSVPTYHKFNDLVDVINQGYKIELDLYRKYEADSKKILVKDLPTFDFLEQFREIQRTSVAEYSDLLNALQLIDYRDKFQLLYFEQTYF